VGATPWRFKSSHPHSQIKLDLCLFSAQTGRRLRIHATSTVSAELVVLKGSSRSLRAASGSFLATAGREGETSNCGGWVSSRARIDPELIASLRESSPPRRPETLLTQPAVEDLVTRLERLEERLGRLEASLPAKAVSAGHTVFVSTATEYRVVEREEPPPSLGAEVSLDGRVYRVTGYRRSPFPADRRPCVIVEQAAAVETPAPGNETVKPA
jgi:hypothetical protein